MIMFYKIMHTWRYYKHELPIASYLQADCMRFWARVKHVNSSTIKQTFLDLQNQDTALIIAVRKGHTDIVKKLLLSQASVDQTDKVSFFTFNCRKYMFCSLYNVVIE